MSLPSPISDFSLIVRRPRYGRVERFCRFSGVATRTVGPTLTNGELSEWFKEHAWKACVGETPSWVRIPRSPFSLPDYQVGGCAIGSCESRQVRKEATVVGRPM